MVVQRPAGLLLPAGIQGMRLSPAQFQRGQGCSPVGPGVGVRGQDHPRGLGEQSLVPNRIILEP